MSTRSFLTAKRFSAGDILFRLFRAVFALGKMLVEIQSKFRAEIFELKMSLGEEDYIKLSPYFLIAQ